MPSLGHVHALAGASGPSLIFSSLVSIGLGGGRKRFGRTDYPMHKPRPFAIAYCPIICTNASIAVSTHSRLMNGAVMRFGSRCGKDGARRGIARSRAQKFGNPVRLWLAAIRYPSG